MKRLLSIFILLIIVCSLAWWLYHPNFLSARHLETANAGLSPNKKVQDRAALAKQYIKKHNYNKRYCFLIDMSLRSGKNRFFIYNLEKDSVEQASLVAHGRCNEMWLEGRRYSNVPGSGCTSLGKYKIGTRYHGQFGLAYKLHGLDSTNNNAYQRNVVLHAYEHVPSSEVFTEICQSSGCPMVSPEFMKKLAARIDKSSKPILLWIYE